MAVVRGLSHLRRRRVHQVKRQGRHHKFIDQIRNHGTRAQMPDRHRRREHSNGRTHGEVDQRSGDARRVHRIVRARAREMMSKFWTKSARTQRGTMAGRYHRPLTPWSLPKLPPTGRPRTSERTCSTSRSTRTTDAEAAGNRIADSEDALRHPQYLNARAPA